MLTAISLAACSVVGVRSAETPHYDVVGQIGAVEVRQYGARLAAETEVTGDEIASRSAGFRRLAGYIFGGNSGGASIAMTAPVAQSGNGTDIAMTAPVAQAQDAGGAWRIRFFMPASYTMATLPQPKDPAVKLVTVPPETMAVLRFTGSTGADAVATETRQLLAALDGSTYRPIGAPVAWFYDPPWTLPWFRRNEVAVSVAPR